jgi:hypothetical protein
LTFFRQKRNLREQNGQTPVLETQKPLGLLINVNHGLKLANRMLAAYEVLTWSFAAGLGPRSVNFQFDAEPSSWELTSERPFLARLAY